MSVIRNINIVRPQTNDNKIPYIILTQTPLEYDGDSNEARCLGMDNTT